MFNSPYSIIEGLYKRKKAEDFLEKKLSKNEKLTYLRLSKIINLLLIINIPLLILVWKYDHYIWGPPFFTMVLCSVRQNYRRFKLNKYGFFNYKRWYFVLFQLTKWSLAFFFIFSGSYKVIFFFLSII